MRHRGALLSTDSGAPKPEDGKRVTVGASLLAAVKAGSIGARNDLRAPYCPPECFDVFEYWQDFNAHREIGMSGLAPITWKEAQAWSEVRRRVLTDFEWDMLLLGDRAFVEGVHEGLERLSEDEAAEAAAMQEALRESAGEDDDEDDEDDEDAALDALLEDDV